MPPNDSDQYGSVIRGLRVSNTKEKEEKEEEEKEDGQRTYRSWRPKIAEILWSYFHLPIGGKWQVASGNRVRARHTP